MTTVYDQYIYKNGDWRKTGGDAGGGVTYTISLSGNTLTLTGSDGSTDTVTLPSAPIQNISVNGTIITVQDGTAAITVPTKTSDLTNDSGFITAADIPDNAFVATWGVTTYAQLVAAIDAGKNIYINIAESPNVNIHEYIGDYDSTAVVLTNIEATSSATTITSVTILASNNSWTGETQADLQEKITASGILKGNGSGGISAAQAGVDYQAAITAANKLLASLIDGLAAVATSGAYSDLSGKPTIPVVLPSPYALSFGNKSYDGSANETLAPSDIGAAAASALASYLALAGGTMAGAIAMGGYKITGLANGTANQDAVTYKQLLDAIAGIGSVFRIQGSVSQYSNLPASGNTIGDVYYVVNDQTVGGVFHPGQTGYIWITISGVDQWEQLGQTIDTRAFLAIADLASSTGGSTNTSMTQAAITNALSGKQAQITANGLLKGNGSGGVSAAVAGTDYQTPLTAGTDYQTPLTPGTDYIAGSDKGAASGVATLDAYGKITPSQATARMVTISEDTTLASTHNGCRILAVGTITITVPGTLTAGTEVEIINYGDGIVTILAASGVSFNGTSGDSKDLENKYEIASLAALTATDWVIHKGEVT